MFYDTIYRHSMQRRCESRKTVHFFLGPQTKDPHKFQFRICHPPIQLSFIYYFICNDGRRDEAVVLIFFSA